MAVYEYTTEGDVPEMEPDVLQQIREIHQWQADIRQAMVDNTRATGELFGHIESLESVARNQGQKLTDLRLAVDKLTDGNALIETALQLLAKQADDTRLLVVTAIDKSNEIQSSLLTMDIAGLMHRLAEIANAQNTASQLLAAAPVALSSEVELLKRNFVLACQIGAVALAILFFVLLWHSATTRAALSAFGG